MTDELNIRRVPAEAIQEGNLIEVATGDVRRVVDIRENGRMFGAWFEFEDRSSMFYLYDELVNRVLETWGIAEVAEPNYLLDDAEALASAGHGTDEDYGYYPED